MANKNLFTTVKLNKPRRNSFNLTHDVKTSFNMGELVPIMCMEAIPGDKFTLGNDSLIRFQPLVSPVMHRFDVTCHYFFVPNRILWPGWEKWIVNEDGAPAFPTLTVAVSNYTQLHDYLGIPTVIAPETETISAFPFAAYQKIFNEYYRDQNLQTALETELVNGDNGSNLALTVLRKRAWEHDYLTSALPFAQKGDPVTIPIGQLNDVPVKTIQNDPSGVTLTGVPDNVTVPFGNIDGIAEGDLFAVTSGLDIGSTTINDLRRAFRLQEWLERNARAGTRYTESILGHFGVKSSDARLQRPEYITGTKSPVIISEVLNTAGVDGERPQGDMAGHAVAVTQGHYGSYFCEEHGYIIGIMSILPKTAYQQGIPKHFIKTADPFQFAWPEFANIGEQEILNKEVYAFQGLDGNLVFGYTPRYAEYKYHPNTVHGDFRTSLDFWHAARIFSTPPALNAAFIESDPTHRIFAVTDPGIDKMLAQVLNKVSVSRLLPVFGTPTF